MSTYSDKSDQYSIPDILAEYVNTIRTGEKVEKNTDKYISYVADVIYKGINKPHKIPPFLTHKLIPDVLKTSSSRLAQKETPPPFADYSRLWQIKNALRAKIKRYKLRRKYNDISKNPNYDVPYVYFPLHYQPELTSSPLGGIYAHQYLIVQLLSWAIPDDWHVYIKEHPVQFSDDRSGNRGRQISHYKEIDSYDNTVLIDISATQSRLLEDAELVATITGTAGFEAIVKGTPAIVFGNAWYRCCSGVFYAQTKQDVKKAIENVINGYIIEEDHIDQFLQALSKVGFEGYLNPSKDKSKVDSSTNIKRIVSEIENKMIL